MTYCDCPVGRTEPGTLERVHHPACPNRPLAVERRRRAGITRDGGRGKRREPRLPEGSDG